MGFFCKNAKDGEKGRLRLLSTCVSETFVYIIKYTEAKGMKFHE